MRRPSPGIHWLVTHLESMTQLLVMMMRGEPSGRVPPRCRSRLAGQFMLGVLDLQAAGGPPSGRDPASSSDRKLTPGRPWRPGSGPGQQPVQDR